MHFSITINSFKLQNKRRQILNAHKYREIIDFISLKVKMQNRFLIMKITFLIKLNFKRS